MDIHTLHCTLDRNITASFPCGDARVFGVEGELDRSNDLKRKGVKTEHTPIKIAISLSCGPVLTIEGWRGQHGTRYGKNRHLKTDNNWGMREMSMTNAHICEDLTHLTKNSTLRIL